MARIDELLKSKGYSDADIEALAPAMRTALEEHFSTLESERNKFKEDVEGWEKWRVEVADPKISTAEQEAFTARRKAADLEEQVKIAREYGLFAKDEEVKPAPPSVSNPNQNFDPKAHKLITHDDIAVYADREGEVIARANDLADEYRHLTGKSLFEYRGQDGKRGMTALREEAKKNGKLLFDYVETKFDFAGKRGEMEKKSQQEYEERIRKEEREKVLAEKASEWANPLLRAPAASRQPFIPPKRDGQGHPWEKSQQDRRNARLENAMKSVLSVQ